MTAVIRGDAKIVQLLLEHGAKLIPNKFGKTPLDIAKDVKDVKVVELVIIGGTVDLLLSLISWYTAIYISLTHQHIPHHYATISLPAIHIIPTKHMCRAKETTLPSDQEW